MRPRLDFLAPENGWKPTIRPDSQDISINRRVMLRPRTKDALTKDCKKKGLNASISVDKWENPWFLFSPACSGNVHVKKVGLSDCTVCDGGRRTSLFLSSIFRLLIDSKDELLSHTFTFAVVTVCEEIWMSVCHTGMWSSTSVCTVHSAGWNGTAATPCAGGLYTVGWSDGFNLTGAMEICWFTCADLSVHAPANRFAGFCMFSIYAFLLGAFWISSQNLISIRRHPGKRVFCASPLLLLQHCHLLLS